MSNKRYDQFATVTPTTSRIILHADPSTGALGKCTLSAALALIPAATDIFSLLQALGSPIKCCVFGNNPLNATSEYIASYQAMYFQMIPCPAFTATGVWYQLTTVGAFSTSTFNGFALYSQSTNTLTKIADTGSHDSFFNTGSVGFRQAAFTSTVALSATTYWLALLYGGGAASITPRFAGNGGAVSSNGYSLGMSNSVTSVVSLASQATPPSTVNFTTAGHSPLQALNIGLY